MFSVPTSLPVKSPNSAKLLRSARAQLKPQMIQGKVKQISDVVGSQRPERLECQLSLVEKPLEGHGACRSIFLLSL